MTSGNVTEADTVEAVEAAESQQVKAMDGGG